MRTKFFRAASRITTDKNIHFNINVQSDGKELSGDYARLRQMFLIVLHNAVKFSPSDGVIDVTVSDRSVEVRDYGPGISSDDMPHIFERFYRNARKTSSFRARMNSAKIIFPMRPRNKSSV